MRALSRPGDADARAKADQSPITLADTESHALLQVGLRSLDAALPILSEESSPADLVGRRDWRRYWLVDPLDGTKEFLAGTGEFTINIALIEDHRPRLGLLYLPLAREAHVGIPGREHWPTGGRARTAGPGPPWRPGRCRAATRSRYLPAGAIATPVSRPAWPGCGSTGAR